MDTLTISSPVRNRGYRPLCTLCNERVGMPPGVYARQYPGFEATEPLCEACAAYIAGTQGQIPEMN